jgi:hypothetical protein
MRELWRRIAVSSAIAVYVLGIGCAGVLLADWLRGSAAPVSLARASAVPTPWAWASGGPDAGAVRAATEDRR